MADNREDVRRWRLRAEELRALADQFLLPSAQDALRRAAANCDKLADAAEARLTGRPPFESEDVG